MTYADPGSGASSPGSAGPGRAAAAATRTGRSDTGGRGDRGVPGLPVRRRHDPRPGRSRPAGRTGRADRRPRSIGQRQDDPAQRARWPGPPDGRDGRHRRARAGRTLDGRIARPAPEHDQLRLPGLRPAPDPERGRERGDPPPTGPGGSSHRRERVARMLELVGLEARAEHRPAELSGGEQQRVAIARALANEPRILLADEPTGQLDSETGHVIMDLIRRVVRDEHVTAIVATHDPAMLDVADRVFELHDGHLIARVGALTWPSRGGPQPLSRAWPPVGARARGRAPLPRR